MNKKSIIITAATVTLIMSSMVPALAATNSANNPTAVQVQQALLNFYSTQKVWPYHFGYFANMSNTQADPTFIGNPPAGTQWDTNVNDWVGLKTVFPGQPASVWVKDLGMTNAPANKPIMAGTLAQWILNWEQDARNVHLTWNGKVSYPTTSAYQLMQLYSVFYGTDIASPKTVINQHDLQMVIKNMTDLSNGYRLLAPNKMELLENFQERFVTLSPTPPAPNYSRWWADGVKEIDSTTLAFGKNGSVTYNRGHFAGMVMIHNFSLVRNGDYVWSNYNPGGFAKPQVQVSEKVPSTMKINYQHEVSAAYADANTIKPYWQPFDGTYFYANFRGPANLTTITGVFSKGQFLYADELFTSAPSYFIKISNGKIDGVMFQNQMNSLPFDGR